MRALLLLLPLPKCVPSEYVAAAWTAGHQGDTPPTNGAHPRGSFLAAHRDAPAPNMEKVVETLTELAQGVDAERDHMMALAKQRETNCSREKAELAKSIRDTNRTALEAQEDLQVADAEIEGLQADITRMKAQMKGTGDEIDKVTQELKVLRQKKGSMLQQSAASLQQVQAVIAKASLREQGQKRQQALSRRAQMSTHVSVLHELGSRLLPSFEEDPSFAASFVQLGASMPVGRVQDGSGIGSVSGVLLADKQEVMLAREDAMKAFDEEEAKLLESLKVLHAELKELEGNLGEYQPSLADKLRQFAEVNLTLVMAKHGIERDTDIMRSLQGRCALMADSAKRLNSLRLGLSDALRMSLKLFQSMDTTMFLSRDLQDLKEGSASLVQLDSHASHLLRSGLAGSPREAMRARLWRDAEQEEPPLQGSARTESPHQGASVAGPLARPVGKLVEIQEEASAKGPFDGVSDMIRTLISSLRDESNADMNRHQWCADNQARNLNQQLTTRGALDTLASQVRWAQTAITRLASEIAFFEAEIPRLRASGAQAQADVDAERTMVQAQLADHKEASDILIKVLVVVRELCQLDGGAASLLQTGRTARAASARGIFDGCAEGSKLVEGAIAKSDGLSEAIQAYMRLFEDAFLAYKDQVEEAADEQQVNLLSATAAKNKRTNELTIAEDAEKSRTQELRLLEKEKRQLETSCGPRVESPEQRLQRKAEEIDALKNALGVLEGQAVPV